MRLGIWCVWLIGFLLALVRCQHNPHLDTIKLMGSLDPETLAALTGSAEAQYPDRPDVFKTTKELRKYLSALDSFYAITGRPRFGRKKKRFMTAGQHY